MNTATPTKSTGTRRQRAAALFPHADVWQLVVAEGNGRMRIVATQSVPAGNLSSLSSVLTSHRVERLIRVIPASHCIVRAVELDADSEADAVDALSLQAEIQLPASLPPHRRSWGLTASPSGSGGRTGLVAGWVEGAQDIEIEGVESTWASEVVALALALDREAGAVIHANGTDGTIAIVASDGRTTAVRTLREDLSSADAWSRSIDRAVTEIRQLKGINSDSVTRNGSAHTLVLQPDLQRRLASRIEGLPDDPAWLSQFAVPALALAAWFNMNPATAPLFQLRPTAPVERRSLPQRVLSWVSDPVHAWTVVGACLLLMAITPLAVAGARLAILQAKAGSLEELQAAQDVVERQVTLHRELEKRRWPMTQLLAHLSGAIPPDIEVNEVRLDAGQRFSIEGESPSDEVVNELQSNLNSLGIFGPVSIEQSEPADGSRGVGFEVRGTVTRPYGRIGNYFEDYSEETLAVRLYGVDTTGQPGTARSSDDADSDTRADADGRTDRSGSRFRNRDSNTRREPARPPSDTRASAPGEVPPPVTDEVLAALTTRVEVMNRTRQVTDALQIDGLDAATLQRLNEDKNRLLAHLRKVK